MTKPIKLIISIVICLVVGNIGTLFTMPSIATWYATLNKPGFNPPNWIFAPVWTTLFILMGISLFLIWNNKIKSGNRKIFFVAFAVNLILNVLWSLIFFSLHLTGLAFIEVILLAISIIILILLSWKISKAAAWLLVPYLLWVCFASFLNYNIWILNPGQTVGTEKNNSSSTEAMIKVFKNEKYGFQFSYPANLIPSSEFKKYHVLDSEWRAEAYNSTGTPIVSLPIFQIENTSTYPRFFDAELRVSASTGTKEVRDCLINDPNIQAPIGDAVIDGINFKVLGIQDAATMKYIEGVSYRTIRNGACLAIEKLKTGSIYRDVSSTKDMPDSVLDSYYNSIDNIIKTFKFIK